MEDEIKLSEIEEHKKSLNVEFNKWIPIVNSLSDVELKQLAKDTDSNLIFTDKHINTKSINIASVFMPLVFLFGSNGRKTGNTRQDKIYNIVLEDERAKYFKDLGKTEEEAKKEFVESIGMIYEYNSKSSPMAINGYPSFMSCKFMSKDDTVKFWKFYEQYTELRTKMDAEFSNI